MTVVAWIEERGWEAVVDAVSVLPGDAEVTLLHVIPGDVIGGPAGAVAGMLGRHRGPHVEAELSRLTAEGARALLAAAAERLGRPAAELVREGRPEHEVLAATAGADVLVLARDDRHPGPRSIGHATRFVVDHATCAVLLVRL